MFRASIPPDKFVFGDGLSIDLMWIDGEVVLRVIDEETKLYEIDFRDKYGQSVEGLWTAFIESWCTIYRGFLIRLRTDAGSVFTSSRWTEVTDSTGITMRISGVESHDPLGSGEVLYDTLRRILRKVQHDHPDIPMDTLLDWQRGR